MNIAESNVFVQNRGSIMRGLTPFTLKTCAVGVGWGWGYAVAYMYIASVS